METKRVRRVACKTLGCRLNQHETDALATTFKQAGYEIVSFDAPADVYVVNTCTITNQGDRKSKSAINRAIRSCAGGIVVVTGCMATSQRDWLEDRDDITYVVENDRKSAIPALVEAHLRGEMLHPARLEGGVFSFGMTGQGFHTRQAVKIQDGCNNFCTYCIVPAVRGRAVSRPAQDVLAHVRKVVDEGAREIVLTGVNISRYTDESFGFADLLEAVLQIEGNFRIRISSIEPEGFTPKVLDLFENPKLCRHLHLCLQSGSDRILRQMRRFYTVAQFRHIIAQYRARFPHFNFSTDVIVGFPGETEDDFAETMAMARDMAFSHIHTFVYSRRAGTRADRMPDQISKEIKAVRSRMVRALADDMKRAYRTQALGQEQDLLVERHDQQGIARGYTGYYHPVRVEEGHLAVNQFQRVKLLECMDDAEMTLRAAVVDDSR